MKITLKTSLMGSAMAGMFALAQPAQAVELEFYFPVAVGGAAAELVQALTDEYVAQADGVQVTPIYSGTYVETMTKTLTASQGGNPPPLSMLGAVNVFTLLDEDLIEPFENHLTPAEAEEWLGGFMPAYIDDTRIDGMTYGIPFQRSTPVMYWNKEAFAEAGLDPETPPADWDELVEMAEKLTKRDASGNVTQYGVRIPSAGFPYWLFQGLTTPAGAILASADGTETYFDAPEVVESLEFLVALSAEHGVMAPGTIDWGATPKAFFERESAIVWTTTGNLTNIRENAPFEFGVAMLPAKAQRGAPTGGGSFFLFKDASEERKAAAVDFLKWLTAPEQAARWSIATGYVAPSFAAWETDAMKAYTADFPAALVARDQLEFAVAELSTYDNSRVTQILNSALEAAIGGQKTPAQALADAQAEADAILSAYR